MTDGKPLPFKTQFEETDSPDVLEDSQPDTQATGSILPVLDSQMDGLEKEGQLIMVKEELQQPAEEDQHKNFQ